MCMYIYIYICVCVCVYDVYLCVCLVYVCVEDVTMRSFRVWALASAGLGLGVQLGL